MYTTLKSLWSVYESECITYFSKIILILDQHMIKGWSHLWLENDSIYVIFYWLWFHTHFWRIQQKCTIYYYIPLSGIHQYTKKLLATWGPFFFIFLHINRISYPMYIYINSTIKKHVLNLNKYKNQSYDINILFHNIKWQ